MMLLIESITVLIGAACDVGVFSKSSEGVGDEVFGMFMRFISFSADGDVWKAFSGLCIPVLVHSIVRLAVRSSELIENMEVLEYGLDSAET